MLFCKFRYTFLFISIGSTNTFIDLLASPWMEEAEKSLMCYPQLLLNVCRGKRRIHWWLYKSHCLNWEKRRFSGLYQESKYRIQLLYWSLPQISYECSSLLIENYGAVTFLISNKFSWLAIYNKKITCRSECCKKYV